MTSPSISSTTLDKPVVFVSSFYREQEDYPHRWSSPLWQLRQDLAALNDDSAFRAAIPALGDRQLTWVAEKSEPPLAHEPDKLAVVDRVVEVLRKSDLYVCILADHRGGVGDHGSSVEVHGHSTAVSYFEIELYAAAMYRKHVVLYVLEGFSPGRRLQSLLRILEFALPHWRSITPQKAGTVYKSIRSLITRHAARPISSMTPLRRHLVRELYRSRTGPMGASGVLFLDGAHESRELPDRDLVEKLVTDSRQATNFQRKLNRLWIAARQLMPASYLPSDVQSDPRLGAFLPLWDCVLADWAAAASWHGWHGHVFAGTVAPLNSQALIRAQRFEPRTGLNPEVVLPPDGALASAYYSVAKILGLSWHGWRCLQRAGRHVQRAINEESGQRDNLLAIRGSIRLRMGNVPAAIADFTEMRQLRERKGESPLRLADALMHEGFAYSIIPFYPRARDLLGASVRILDLTEQCFSQGEA